MEKQIIAKDKPIMGKKSFISIDEVDIAKYFNDTNLLLEKLDSIQYGQTMVVVAHKVN